MLSLIKQNLTFNIFENWLINIKCGKAYSHRFLNSSGILGGGLSTKAKEYIHARDKKKSQINIIPLDCGLNRRLKSK